MSKGHPKFDALVRRRSHTGSAWDREWVAWRQVCKHLEKLGIDVNAATSTPLVMAVRLWGEQLVELRTVQEHDGQERADDPLDEALKKYETHVIEDGES